MAERRLRGSIVAAILLGSGLMFLVWASSVQSQESPEPCSAVPDPTRPDLACAAPPNTFDVTRFFAANATAADRAQAGPTFDAWAWAAFAAMNWPAREDQTQPTGYLRGVPSASRTFLQAAPDDVLVWETFKEKRELFQPTDTPPASRVSTDSKWQDITFGSQQQPRSPSNPGGLPPCAGTKPIEREHHRLVSQGSKSPNTGDETVQVASPPLETTDQLCAGYDASTTPTLEQCRQIFPARQPHSDRNVSRRPPVGPRVWNGDPSNPAGARPLYYEVKVNYDFWDYILQRRFFLDSVARPAAASPDRNLHPKLPFRTSAPRGPGRSRDATYDYDAASTAAAYGMLSDPNTLPGAGSIQLKAAWLRLLPSDDKTRFHTTEAVFYRTIDPSLPPDAPDNTCYEVDEFGLLGLHIIQRVHSSVFSRVDPQLFAYGGTFVFATWEHVGLGEQGQPTDYFYANYLTNDDQLPPGSDFEVIPFPNFTAAGTSAINVVRMHPYPLATTREVNRAVHAQLPQGSVWRNYRLVGTQFAAVDSPGTQEVYNQPYYLANLVVETNQGLQNFQGLPPKVTVTRYYTDKVSIRGTTNEFAPSSPNVIFNRELKPPVNMGGCMGCHGVAQLKGFDFSFVFADGQAGAGLDTQRHFEVAGAVSGNE